jgi:hypothetical protein
MTVLLGAPAQDWAGALETRQSRHESEGAGSMLTETGMRASEMVAEKEWSPDATIVQGRCGGGRWLVAQLRGKRTPCGDCSIQQLVVRRNRE